MSETVGSSKENQEWLMKEVNKINIMLSGGFPMLREAKELYRDRLADCRKDYISHVLSEVCRWKTDKMPTVGVIRDEYLKHQKRENNTVRSSSPIAEDDATAERSLKSMAISFMYMHYKHGYNVLDNTFLHQIYRKLFGDDPFNLDKLQQKITREMVIKYVEERKSNTANQ